jgi:hypothetical protein
MDHVATFKGNCDDNFRVGVKVTRKSLKIYAEFYGADLILASPLGLRMAIEKTGSVASEPIYLCPDALLNLATRTFYRR